MSARHLFARLSTPVSADLIGQNDPDGTDYRSDFIDGAFLPSPMTKNVSQKGRMVDGGYQPENHQWGSALTETVNGKCVGRNPMTIDPAVLTDAGHGPRRTSAVVVAIEMPVNVDVRECRDIRKHCLQCSDGNDAEVRRCPIYDCAAWIYRMGKNPHNPKRGASPFEREKNRTDDFLAAHDTLEDA
jgi:hypothetical protein